jgi:chromosome segregation ATPase
VDKLANQLLGPHLDEAIQRLLNGIGTQFESKLEPLSLAIREQSPQGMMEQFLSVVTSGASVATTSFHGTMERMEALLPQMLERIRQAAEDAQRSNTEVYAALAAESEKSEARLVRLNDAVTESVANVRTVVDALVEHARGTLSSVAAQTNDAVGAMAASSRDVSKELAIQVSDLVRSMRSEHEKAEEQSATARERALQRQADAASQFIDDLQRQLSDLGKLDQSRIASIRTFNQELNQVIASFAAERGTLENSSRELDRRAQVIEVQQERVIELTNRTSAAGVQREKALAALAARAREDEKLIADTQTQVAQIRLRSEELEGALKRIATEVANTMTQELKLVNDQVAKNAQLVDEIAARLGDKVVASLAETVDDLKSAVDGLLKTTAGQGTRR